MTPEELAAIEARADSAQFIIARTSLPPVLRESLRKSAADVPALVVTLREARAEAERLRVMGEQESASANAAEAERDDLHKRLTKIAVESAVIARTALDQAARAEAAEAKVERLTTERDEALDELQDTINQACRADDGVLDSQALSAYAGGMRLLARHGRLIITDQFGRRVIGHWHPAPPRTREREEETT